MNEPKWKIEWHPRAAENLANLPKDIKDRVIKRIDKMQDNPFHFLEHYEGQDFYKFRVGDYRALVDIDFENKIIKIQVFGHRKKIYKRIK
jgi:mRNA-degrading endonuclease RelE of RelBE toxin-antitoxin system